MTKRFLTIVLSLSVVTGCATFDIEKSLSNTNESIAEFTGGNLQLQTTGEQKANAKARADKLLDNTLDQAGAIEVALLNSPSVQRMLADAWAQSASVALSGSIPNPVFEFGRVTSGAELEIERVLAIGLLDLIRLPSLSKTAGLQLEANQLALSASAVDLVTQVRQAWVNAVVTQQLASYAEMVFSSAEASASLATQMQAIGNFNALARARQQAYYADAATSLTLARHASVAARESLVRLLGLDQTQSTALKLPEQLPPLPDTPLTPSEVSSVATTSRLDVNIAVAELQATTSMQGIKLLGDMTDIEVAGIRNTMWNGDDRETIKGYTLGIELPLFKSIAQVRNRMNAKSLAAVSALESLMRSANSHLRESYSAYRSSYDVARHYSDEVLPLQRLISEENVLNYNGMLIGVFELLADSRAQIKTVQSSIEAVGQYWLAEAALRASIVGNPTETKLAMSAGDGGGEGGGH